MSRRGWALFVAMCLIWGIPYLLIKVAVSDISPVTLVNPAVALALGVTLLGEPFTIGVVVGFALILLGLFLATRRASKTTTRVLEHADKHLADVR